jgi:hypothetical protein
MIFLFLFIAVFLFAAVSIFAIGCLLFSAIHIIEEKTENE